MSYCKKNLVLGIIPYDMHDTRVFYGCRLLQLCQDDLLSTGNDTGSLEVLVLGVVRHVNTGQIITRSYQESDVDMFHGRKTCSFCSGVPSCIDAGYPVAVQCVTTYEVDQ